VRKASFLAQADAVERLLARRAQVVDNLGAPPDLRQPSWSPNLPRVSDNAYVRGFRTATLPSLDNTAYVNYADGLFTQPLSV